MSETVITFFPRMWLKTFTEPELERLAIMTIDGDLTDDEALNMSGLRSKLQGARRWA